MAKAKTRYVCRSCGSVQIRWMGKCPDCGEWDGLETLKVEAAPVVGIGNATGGSGWAAAGSLEAASDPQRGLAAELDWVVGVTGDSSELGHNTTQAVPLEDVQSVNIQRLPTGIGEFDRVLGGGLVPGSTILVGGEPGIGKSTLLLQVAAQMGREGQRVLYVTSEESAQQIQMRAKRLGYENTDGRLYILADTNLARVFEQARQIKPSILVIDSIQMVYRSNVDSSPGSVTQLRQCCMELVYLAKTTGTCVLLVGHVTKEGRVAGPRMLEHLVDSVLYFEGDRYHAHRIVRGVKNRYGSTLEIGVFEMTGQGLCEVVDPGMGILATVTGMQHDKNDQKNDHAKMKVGSVVCPTMQGSRCFLVEMQSLTVQGILGGAKRKASGVDTNRLAMLIAVLEKHAELRLADQDIFTSVVGGVRVIEPAADLSIALAIAGAHMNRAIGFATVVFGEVGLGGEIRPVHQTEQRLREAARLGFKYGMIAKTGDRVSVKGIKVIPVSHVLDAFEMMQ